jgi:thioredoxin-related protein
MGIFSADLLASDRGFVIDNYEVANSISKETKFPLLIIHSADYCVYCDRLKKDIMVSELLDSIIVCVIDIETNKELSSQMKVKKLPTSILMNSQDVEISRKVGYSKKEYKEWLEKNIKISR